MEYNDHHLIERYNFNMAAVIREEGALWRPWWPYLNTHDLTHWNKRKEKKRKKKKCLFKLKTFDITMSTYIS